VELVGDVCEVAGAPGFVCCGAVEVEEGREEFGAVGRHFEEGLRFVTREMLMWVLVVRKSLDGGRF